MGPPTVLSDSEENIIVKLILAKARVGYPIHPETLKESNKPNPFTDDRPGKKSTNGPSM